MGKDKIKFLLKNPKAENETLIYLVLREGFRFKFSVREKVKPGDWNAEAQRMREARGLPWRNFNQRLDLIQNKCTDLVLILKNNNRLTSAALNRELSISLGWETETGFVEYVKAFIAYEKEQGNFERIKSVQTMLHLLQKFSAETRAEISFQNITANFVDSFRAWLDKQTIETKDGLKKGYSFNYVGRILMNLKRMYNYSFKEGLHGNDKPLKIGRKGEDVYKIYLTEPEIDKIIAADLPKYLRNARDHFIIGCYTGLRVGNFLKIDPDLNINLETGYIQAVCNKGGPRVLIPIHPRVKDIILRGMPHTISEQKVNKYIKDVCKAAGITDNVVWYRTEGGRRVEYVTPKWELVSNHTARRSFATNAYKAGLLPYEIMQITGHRSEKTFFKYICITQEQAAERMAKHPFFNR